MSANALRTIDDEWYLTENTVNELERSSIKSVFVAGPQLSSPSVVDRSDWAGTAIARLRALVPLRDNWDQRGSAAVKRDVLSFAWQLLSQIMPADGVAPVIVPLGSGGIQLEWSSETAELEVEITRPFEMFALLVERVDGDEVETELPTDSWDQLTEAIRRHFRS